MRKDNGRIDGRSNSGSADAGSAGNAGPDSDSVAAGTDAGSAGPIANSRRTAGESRSVGTESGGTGNETLRSVDSSGNSVSGFGGDDSGAGKRRGRPVGSRNRVGADSGSATETRVSNEDVSGLNQKPPRRTRAGAAEAAGKIAIGVTTRDLIADSWTAAYWIPAQLTGVREIELADTEVEILTSRTEALIKSMGTKRAKATLALLDKYAPGVSLAVAVSIITLPKIRIARLTLDARANAYASLHAQPIDNRAPDYPAGNIRQSATSGDSGFDPSLGKRDKSTTVRSVQPLTASDIDILGGSNVSADNG